MTPTADAEFVERIRARLKAALPADDLLSALEQFSGPMLDELLGRISTIETKAISVLGWSVALLGFLLLQQASVMTGSLVTALTRLTIAAALIAVFTAASAARARRWKWPDVTHWFCEEEFDDVARLRATHLLALLEGYQAHERHLKAKGRALQISQGAVIVASVLVAIAIVVSP